MNNGFITDESSTFAGGRIVAKCRYLDGSELDFTQQEHHVGIGAWRNGQLIQVYITYEDFETVSSHINTNWKKEITEDHG